MPLSGVDVSADQSDAVLNLWFPKSKFAFFKATEGKGYDAPAYAHQVAMGRALAGFYVGAYHYAWPENGFQADLDHFLATAGLRIGEAGMLDFEPWSSKQPLADPATFPTYVVGFADGFKAAKGVDPVWYAPDIFVSEIKAHATTAQWDRIAQIPFAKPGDKGAYVTDPSAGYGDTFGLNLAMWQWTSTPVDQDLLYVPWSTIAVTK